MANIVTAADIEKFIALFKIGLENGKQKELKNYSSFSENEPDSYVSLEFSFRVDKSHIEDLLINDGIKDLIKNL